METNSTKISFKQTFIFLAVFVIIVAILMGGLMIADHYHKEGVYNRYADETNAYIINNRAALVQLFTQYFPNQYTCYSGQNSTECPPPTSADTIAHLLQSTLKDWSSTTFIKINPSGELLKMELGGGVSQSYIYPAEKEAVVRQLLSGEKTSIPWDDYNYAYGEREVIIPVKDESGKILGGIVRGVIE